MTTQEIENFDTQVVSVIETWFRNEGFKSRKLTDTPTDALQVVNKDYCDSNSGAFQLVSYQTASNTTTISVSGLNLQTDGRYRVYYKMGNSTIGLTNGNPAMLINGDVNNSYYNGGQEQVSTTYVSSDYGTTAGTQANLFSTAIRCVQGVLEFSILELDNNDANNRVSWFFQGQGLATSPGSTMVNLLGGGVNINEANLNTLTLFSDPGNTKNWEIAVYKLATS